VCLVSYPASGDVWLRALIGKALCEKYRLDERLIFREPSLTKAAGVLRTVCTHGDADPRQGKHYVDLETNRARYQCKRIILLIRDPRDVVVSSYLHASGPKGGYTGSISDFVRSDHHGIRKIVTFYKIWHANRQVPEAFLPIPYDDLLTDPGRTLRRALELIDAQDYSDEIINRAIEYGSCDHFKMEGETHVEGTMLKPGDDTDQERYMDRRDRGGGYVDYLNQEDQEYVNGVIDELGNDLFIEPWGSHPSVTGSRRDAGIE
jgi:hypothetical protein